MAAATAYTLRPLERSTTSLDQGAFRVHFSTRELKNLGFTSGDLIRITTSKGFHGYAVAWPAQQTNPGNKPIARMADVLREQYELNLTDTVCFEKANDDSKPLASIAIRFAQGSDVLCRYSAEELNRCLEFALGNTKLLSSAYAFLN
jgi:AAA family ATPase